MKPKKEIVKFIKDSVKQLQNLQEGCSTYILDDHLAVCVGWSAGYGKEKRNDVIQAKDNLDYGINVGIKVWTSDSAMLTDYDWINFPYEDNGEVLDLGFEVLPNENYENLTKEILKCYDEVKDLVLNDKGMILKNEAI